MPNGNYRKKSIGRYAAKHGVKYTSALRVLEKLEADGTANGKDLTEPRSLFDAMGADEL